MLLVTQAEYARRHGVARKTVTQWKQDGWIVTVDGRVDVEASDARLAQVRKPKRKPVRGAPAPVAASELAPAIIEPTAAEADDSGDAVTLAEQAMAAGKSPAEAAQFALTVQEAPWQLDEAVRQKENFLALLKQLEYHLKAGEVVPVSDIEKAVGLEFAKVRTRLLAIPSEQAPHIYRMKTVPEVQDALRTVIIEALEELTVDGGPA